jgi:hypothetical protein
MGKEVNLAVQTNISAADSAFVNSYVTFLRLQMDNHQLLAPQLGDLLVKCSHLSSRDLYSVEAVYMTSSDRSNFISAPANLRVFLNPA